MTKPNALTQLIEELQGEAIHSDVDVLNTSKAVIYLTDEATEQDDGVELNGGECALLFANRNTIERFVEALDLGRHASLSLFDVGVSGPMLELLERSFVTVDEG